MISILQGVTGGAAIGEEPVILLADDLAPSETVQLDKSKVLSFVTQYGSTNSHTAILARTMNIPALISVDLKNAEEMDGKWGIVDGYRGTLYVEPDAETISKYEKLKEEEEQKKRLLQQLKGKEDITLDGRKIKLYANIGSVADVANVLANDAGGIGLFRSEFLYLESNDYPAEEAQFTAYKTVAETPAAVMISDLLAKEVDFFSVGTNDLTQYTLAIDRQNPKLDNIYDAHHEAVLRMLKMVVDHGHKEGCWVGICGELGADVTLTETFLRMGFDELSVSPSMVLKVRDKIRSLDLSES